MVVVLVMLGTATKLKTARNIKIQGAVSGNANFDGSANVTINTIQNNIEVLKGSISISASDTSGIFNGTASVTVAYPAGYTKDNCKVLSISTALSVQGLYSTGSIPKFVATDLQKGMVPIFVTRANDNLTIKAYNAATQVANINYEIVLIKF